MANITTDAYQKKTWTANDIVTADDLNNIENGVSNNNTGLRNVQERATSLENRTTSLETKTTSLETRAATLETKTSSLESRATSLESRAKELENKTDEFENEINSAEGGILARLNAVESQYTALNNSFNTFKEQQAVTKSNFSDVLGEQLVIDETVSCTVMKDGVSGQVTLEKKNMTASLIKHKYYKRTTTLTSGFSATLEIPSQTYSGLKAWYCKICDIDSTKTNTMSASDIAHFISISKISGFGSYTTEIYIENNEVRCRASLWGGGFAIPVHLKLSISFLICNDQQFYID